MGSECRFDWLDQFKIFHASRIEEEINRKITSLQIKILVEQYILLIIIIHILNEFWVIFCEP